MTPMLYAHPFSSYCQKVLIALYENATAIRIPHARRRAGDGRACGAVAAAALSGAGGRGTHGDGGEHHHRASGPASSGPDAARPGRPARRARRAADGSFLRQLRHDADGSRSCLDGMRPPDRNAIRTVSRKRARCSTPPMAGSNERMAGRDWASGDVSASPTAPPRRRCSTPTGRIRSASAFANVRAYRRRLLARPSFARAVDEARPYRPLFPLGAPDRD